MDAERLRYLNEQTVASPYGACDWRLLETYQGDYQIVRYYGAVGA